MLSSMKPLHVLVLLSQLAAATLSNHDENSSKWKLKKFKSLVTFGDSYTDESRFGYFASHNGSAPPVGWVDPVVRFILSRCILHVLDETRDLMTRRATTLHPEDTFGLVTSPFLRTSTSTIMRLVVPCAPTKSLPDMSLLSTATSHRFSSTRYRLTLPIAKLSQTEFRSWISPLRRLFIQCGLEQMTWAEMRS